MELDNIKEYTYVLKGKYGLTKAFGAYLATLSHVVLMYQVIAYSWGVIMNTKGIADALLWMVLFLLTVIFTPKLLNMSESSSLLFIKAYTIIINSIFAAFFIFTIYSLLVSKGYIVGDLTPSIIEHNHEDLKTGVDFPYINAIFSLYISFFGFALYINKHVPDGYLNYASAPIFVILTFAIIAGAFNSSNISLYNYFDYSGADASFRILMSMISVGLFLLVVRKTVFNQFAIDSISINSEKKAEQ